jgi:hypothetical protein
LLKAIAQFAKFRSHGVINHAAFLFAWIANQPPNGMWLFESSRCYEPRSPQIIQRNQAAADSRTAHLVRKPIGHRLYATIGFRD